MTEHSPAALAAFPDHHTPALSYCALCARVGWDRTAFDLGAATTWATTREALVRHLFERRYGRKVNDTEWQQVCEYNGEKLMMSQNDANAILASGALMDVREVQVKALEAVADYLTDRKREYRAADDVRERALEIGNGVRP